MGIAFLFDRVTSAILPVEPRALSMIRLFRLIRVFKLLNTFKGFEILYLLTTAIRGTRSILRWAIALLSIILMTCALFLTQGLHLFYFGEEQLAALHPSELEVRIKMYRYFGTFTRSMFSMFELTLANYPPVARLLSEEVSEWFSLLCL